MTAHDHRDPPADVQLLKAQWHIMRGALRGVMLAPSLDVAQDLANFGLVGIREPGHQHPRVPPAPPNLRIVE